MKGMTAQERYEEISKLSGFSTDVVRRVLSAEKQSIINSLKRGERATLMGRCVIIPELRRKLEVGGNFSYCIKLKAKPASALESALRDLTDFEGVEDKDDENIELLQIPSLL